MLELFEEERPKSDDETIEEVPENVELVPGTDDVIVFARTPQEMARAQDALVATAKRRVRDAEENLRIARGNLEEAKEAKIRTAPWRTQVRKYEKEHRFYNKVLGALEEGYFIVPDFPVNIIAVRTHNEYPADQGDYKHRGSIENEPHQELPIGEGEYVDTVPVATSFEDVEEKDGKPVTVRKWSAGNNLLRKMDFPFRLVRPHLLRDLRKAADKRIFDALAVMPGPQKHNPDPMLLGIIENRTSKYNVKRLIFLIKWWVPTSAI